MQWSIQSGRTQGLIGSTTCLLGNLGRALAAASVAPSLPGVDFCWDSWGFGPASLGIDQQTKNLRLTLILSVLSCQERSMAEPDFYDRGGRLRPTSPVGGKPTPCYQSGRVTYDGYGNFSGVDQQKGGAMELQVCFLSPAWRVPA
jgi:hypothetical protein